MEHFSRGFIYLYVVQSQFFWDQVETDNDFAWVSRFLVGWNIFLVASYLYVVQSQFFWDQMDTDHDFAILWTYICIFRNLWHQSIFICSHQNNVSPCTQTYEIGRLQMATDWAATSRWRMELLDSGHVLICSEFHYGTHNLTRAGCRVCWHCTCRISPKMRW